MMQTDLTYSIPLDVYEKFPRCESVFTDGRNVRAYFEKKSRKKLPKYCYFLKKSLDARHKNDIRVVLTVRFQDQDMTKELKFPKLTELSAVASEGRRAVVCGSGPAGLFAAMTLLQAGIRPILIEMGRDVDTRSDDVQKLKETGELLTFSNVQFGEGGAGTFSDGKLFSGVSSPKRDAILRTFVKYGAPASILYEAHPHIGTDHLRKVVRNMREDFVARGGRVLFERKVCDLDIQNGRITKIYHCSSVDGKDVQELSCSALLLAIGHSSRDTFYMLDARGVHLESKDFAIGVRIEHLQKVLDRAQFGELFENEILHPAIYKVVTPTSTNRKLYSFCMCPGGEVVCGASEERGVVTNGMSEYSRDRENANSAMLVGVTKTDFPDEKWDSGIRLQRDLERKAFLLGEKPYFAPAQRVGDFHMKKVTTEWGKVRPSYLPGVTKANLWSILPKEVAMTIDEGLTLLDKKIHGFNDPDAVLTAVETRSSSPVRIRRDENGESLNVKGLYPTGEGAGYAGGIMSSAIDGINQAEMVIKNIFC